MTVQTMADFVAKVGQIVSPYSTVRDLGMWLPTRYLHGLEEYIFESVVCHSLGGSSGSLHWLPPINQS